MATTDKPLAWLRGEVRTPPFSAAGRLEAGVLLRKTTPQTPARVIADGARRLRQYDLLSRED